MLMLVSVWKSLVHRVELLYRFFSWVFGMGSDKWLAQVQEDIIDPGRKICDAHHHLFHYPNAKQPVKYMLEDVLADISSGHKVVSTVYAECGSMYRNQGPQVLRSIGETEFVAGVAAMCDSGTYANFETGLLTRVALGTVGFVDLTAGPAVGAALDKHMAITNRFKGIRHVSAWDASPEIKRSHTHPPKELLADKNFRAGFAELAPRGLSFDAWLYHPQIQELDDLAHSFPETTIVIDHFGGPIGIGPYTGKGAEVLADWKPLVKKLSKNPNVVAKLGGLLMPVNGFGFHKAAMPPNSDTLVKTTREYYLHMIDCFGPQRCMFESNFPMDRLSCSYAVLWNSFKKLVADYSESDKNALFHDTANQVYRLDA